MKTILTMISAGLLFIATSCNKSQDVQPASDNSSISDRGTSITPTPDRVDQRIVYFSKNQYAVRLKPNGMLQPATGGDTKTNTLYIIKTPAGTDIQYLAVVSALPGADYNANLLWQAVELYFTGYYSKPFQMTSAEEIDRLLSTSSSGLTAVKTNSYYEMQMAPLQDQPPAIQ